MVSTTHTYRGNAEVNFIYDEGLSVTIDTERLHIRSVEATESEYESYGDLFGDPEVMSTVCTGATETRADMEAHVRDFWVSRWNNRDPFSGLTVTHRETEEFLGHVGLGHGDRPGEAELGYLFMKRHWRKGYATEAATAVVREFAPATAAEGFTVNCKFLKTIVATARPDNPASVRILEGLGMHKVGEGEKWGGLRCHFTINLTELPLKI